MNTGQKGQSLLEWLQSISQQELSKPSNIMSAGTCDFRFFTRQPLMIPRRRHKDEKSFMQYLQRKTALMQTVNEVLLPCMLTAESLKQNFPPGFNSATFGGFEFYAEQQNSIVTLYAKLVSESNAEFISIA